MTTELDAAARVRQGDIDVNVVPGTVDLVDVNHSHEAKHLRSQEDIILVPTPSDDPDDPLNWSPRRLVLTLDIYSMLPAHAV